MHLLPVPEDGRPGCRQKNRRDAVIVTAGTRSHRLEFTPGLREM